MGFWPLSQLFFSPKVGHLGQIWAQKEAFVSFLKFGLLFYLSDFAHNDSSDSNGLSQ